MISSSLSRSEGATQPVSAGVYVDLSESVIGCKRWPLLGIFLTTQTHLLTKVQARPEKVACSCAFAMEASCSSSRDQF